jgi:hypothetical protein
MDETKKRIADMTCGMDFEKKPRASKKEKEEYAALESSTAGIKKDIDKLSLRLWHACNKGDYRSLPLDEAKKELLRVKDAIEEIISKEY